jgi:hypothetical protein
LGCPGGRECSEELMQAYQIEIILNLATESNRLIDGDVESGKSAADASGYTCAKPNHQ